MSKFLLAILVLFSFQALQAQTFTGAGGAIPDNGPAHTCFPITVSGVGPLTGSHGLASVCLNITHASDGDLQIELKAPDGTIIQLSNGNGSVGDNYTGTCFSQTGAADIGSGTPPFTGVYIPEQNLGSVNNNNPGDGVWSLCIQDNFAPDAGSLVDWSITFSNSPAPPVPPLPPCLGNPPAGDACSDATPVCNFEGYCGNTSASYNIDTWTELTDAFGANGGCGGSIENNSFITFVASATTASFNVWVTSSTQGSGIQMMFYDGGCGSGAVTTYGCYANIGDLPPDGLPHLVTASGLTPGNTYYLMFDGYGGDVCDYSLAPLSGVNILNVDPANPTVCVGSSVSLTASGGNGNYSWTGPNLSATTGTIVSASPTVTSTYTVTSVDPTGSCPVTKSFTVNITNTPYPPNVTTPVNYCQGSAAVPLAAAGTALQWYTVATGGTGSSTAPTPSTATIGTVTYYVTQTLTCGTSVRTPVVVNVSAQPAAPAVNPVGYCQGAIATPLTAAGTGLLWYTTATGGIGSPTAPTPSTAATGTTTYYVSQTSGTCEGPRAAITVTVNSTPLAPVVTTPVSYCQGTTASALTATGTNLLWYTTATGGVGNSTAPTPSTAVTGTTTYYVNQTNGTCQGPRVAIVVNVVLATPPPTATSPITYCQGGTAIPLTATGTALLWYTAATGGTGSATAPTPPTGAIGSTTWYVSQTLSCGESTRLPVTVNITSTPAAPVVTTPITYCQGSTAAALGATGTGLLWYTTATGGTGSATAPIPSTATVGNTIYYVSQATGSCEGPRAAIIVTIKIIPTAPSVTTPVIYCQGATSTTLSAPGTGLLWYTTTTGGTGSSSAPIPLTAIAGNTIYYVSQTVATCESPRAAITVTVNATPAAPATGPVIYCRGAIATALTATGTNLLWYTGATGGTGSTIAPIPSTATAGSTIYYVSQSTGTCEGPRAAITVTVNALPGAPLVTTPVIYCQGNGAAALTATGTGLLWYITATGGTGIAAAPVPSTTTPGNTVYYVSQTTTGCEGPRAAITVTVKSNPLPPVVTSPVIYCQGETPAILGATGSGLLWYTAATGGTGSITAPTPTTTAAGNTIYYVSQTVATCEGPRAPITVTVNATPAAPGTSPVNYCQGATAVPLTATGTNLLWYAAATGGTGNSTAPTPLTATAGSTTFYVSQSTGACEGPRASITVTVNGLPVAPSVTTPVVYCQGSTSALLTATGTGLLWYTTSTGGTGGTAPLPSTTTVGNTIYYVSQTLTGCEGPRAALIVTVKITPAAPVVNSPVVYCQGVIPSILTATGSNLLWYTTAAGGTGIVTAPTPSAVSVGNINFYVSQTTGTCEGPRALITVTVNSTPPAPAVSPVNYCRGDASVALSATGTNLLWYTAATGGTGSSVAPTPSTASIGSVTYYVSQSTGTCEGPRAALIVTINTVPLAPVVNSPVVYCQGTTATALTATGTGNLVWYTTVTGGTGSPIAPTPSTNIIGNTIYYVSLSNGTCEGPRAAITVTVNITPEAPLVTSPVTYCQGTSSVGMSATGTNLLWYTAATGGIGSTQAPVPQTAINGTTNYYVSQTTGVCEGARALLAVVINVTPAAPGTNPITYCQGSTATAVTATGTNLLWYSTANGGTGSSLSPTPSTTFVGATTYYVSQTTGVCEGPRASITVTINSTPGLPSVSGNITSHCQNTIATPLTAAGTGLLWYTAPTGGTGNPAAPVPGTSSAGSFTYYVSQTTGTCEGPRASIPVTVIGLPAPPTVSSPVVYCQSAVPAALAAIGSSLLWYSTATGGTGNPSAPTPSTASAGNIVYYVSQTTTGCEGPRASITITTNATPAPPVVSATPVEYCQGKPAGALTATGDNLLWYYTLAGGSGNNSIVPPTSIAGSFNYYCSQTILGCEGPRSTINVIINSGPDLGHDVKDTACYGDSVDLSNKYNTAGFSIKWTFNGVEIDPSTVNAVKSSGIYQLEATNNSGCADTALVYVTILPKVKAFAGNDTTAIKGAPHQLMGSGGATYLWSPATSLDFATAQYPLAILDHDQQFFLEVTDIGGCKDKDTLFVKVYEGPTYYVPNAFTPNNDGINDVFRVVPVGISYTEWFRVFNRFGELVFSTNQWLKGWDGTYLGKPQQAGTYVWVIKGMDRNGNKVEMKGTVLLIH